MRALQLSGYGMQLPGTRETMREDSISGVPRSFSRVPGDSFAFLMSRADSLAFLVSRGDFLPFLVCRETPASLRFHSLSRVYRTSQVQQARLRHTWFFADATFFSYITPSSRVLRISSPLAKSSRTLTLSSTVKPTTRRLPASGGVFDWYHTHRFQAAFLEIWYCSSACSKMSLSSSGASTSSSSLEPSPGFRSYRAFI